MPASHLKAHSLLQERAARAMVVLPHEFHARSKAATPTPADASTSVYGHIDYVRDSDTDPDSDEDPDDDLDI